MVNLELSYIRYHQALSSQNGGLTGVDKVCCKYPHAELIIKHDGRLNTRGGEVRGIGRVFLGKLEKELSLDK